MVRGTFHLAAVFIFAACGSAAAAQFTAHITEPGGQAVAGAVVMLVPEDAAALASAPRLETRKTVDQSEEVFIPLVTIIPPGGSVVFTNSDRTMHQVYSFSAIKQFELTVAHGAKSEPVVFDQPGVAALGCNIHDNMIAYVFVARSPWVGLTGDDGMLTFADVPEGRYAVEIWHPRLPPVGEIPRRFVSVGAGPAAMTHAIGLMPDRSLSRTHRGHY